MSNQQMSTRDKMRVSVQPYLVDGEQVQEVASAQTVSGWWMTLGFVGAIVALQAASSSIVVAVVGGALSTVPFNLVCKYRTVVVTNRRIVVLARSAWAVAKVTSVRRELSRGTRIGPPNGMWYKTTALGERLYIPRGFHKDIARADAAITELPTHTSS